MIDVARAPVHAFDAIYSFQAADATRAAAPESRRERTDMALMPLLMTTATVVIVDVRDRRCGAVTV